MQRMTQAKSIRRVGLKNHLDQTAHHHNNFSYDDFVSMLNSNVNKTNIAKAFKVTRLTVMKWIVIYYEEQDNLIEAL